MFNRIHNFLNPKYNQSYDFDQPSDFINKIDKIDQIRLPNLDYVINLDQSCGLLHLVKKPITLCNVDEYNNSLSDILMDVSEGLFIGAIVSTLSAGAACVYCCALCVSGLVMASPFLLCNTLLSKSFVLMNITLDKMIENAK